MKNVFKIFLAIVTVFFISILIVFFLNKPYIFNNKKQNNGDINHSESKLSSSK